MGCSPSEPSGHSGLQSGRPVVANWKGSFFGGEIVRSRGETVDVVWDDGTITYSYPAKEVIERGMAVEVKWGGEYWKARVRRVLRGGKVEVEWDARDGGGVDLVSASDLRRPPSPRMLYHHADGVPPPPRHLVPAYGGYSWTASTTRVTDPMQGPLLITTYEVTTDSGRVVREVVKTPAPVAPPPSPREVGKLMGKARAAGEVNEGVLRFALESMGKRVGNGECGDFGASALRAADAAPGLPGPPVGVVWGKMVELRKVAPGDILQFKLCVFEGERNGASYRVKCGEVSHGSFHTAIVLNVLHAGSRPVIETLEQNVAGSPVVRNTLDFRDKVSGQVIAYRPIPKTRYRRG